jgi:hypothetical protein
MKPSNALWASRILLVAGATLAQLAWADVELTAPDGRRVLLKDDGTWRYDDMIVKEKANERSSEGGEAILLLERRVERGNNCRFVVQLVNNLTYEIRNFVPYFSAYRANGVLHDTISSLSAFTILRPGDTQNREIEFTGIACQSIARLQVVGGDRCEMGDLNKFSEAKGQCLARVRVVSSDLLRFEK